MQQQRLAEELIRCCTVIVESNINEERQRANIRLAELKAVDGIDDISLSLLLQFTDEEIQRPQAIIISIILRQTLWDQWSRVEAHLKIANSSTSSIDQQKINEILSVLDHRTARAMDTISKLLRWSLLQYQRASDRLSSGLPFNIPRVVVMVIQTIGYLFKRLLSARTLMPATASSPYPQISASLDLTLNSTNKILLETASTLSSVDMINQPSGKSAVACLCAVFTAVLSSISSADNIQAIGISLQRHTAVKLAAGTTIVEPFLSSSVRKLAQLLSSQSPIPPRDFYVLHSILGTIVSVLEWDFKLFGLSSAEANGTTSELWLPPASWAPWFFSQSESFGCPQRIPDTSLNLVHVLTSCWNVILQSLPFMSGYQPDESRLLRETISLSRQSLHRLAGARLSCFKTAVCDRLGKKSVSIRELDESLVGWVYGPLIESVVSRASSELGQESAKMNQQYTSQNEFREATIQTILMMLISIFENSDANCELLICFCRPQVRTQTEEQNLGIQIHKYLIKVAQYFIILKKQGGASIVQLDLLLKSWAYLSHLTLHTFTSDESIFFSSEIGTVLSELLSCCWRQLSESEEEENEWTVKKNENGIKIKIEIDISTTPDSLDLGDEELHQTLGFLAVIMRTCQRHFLNFLFQAIGNAFQTLTEKKSKNNPNTDSEQDFLRFFFLLMAHFLTEQSTAGSDIPPLRASAFYAMAGTMTRGVGIIPRSFLRSLNEIESVLLICVKQIFDLITPQINILKNDSPGGIFSPSVWSSVFVFLIRFTLTYSYHPQIQKSDGTSTVQPFSQLTGEQPSNIFVESLITWLHIALKKLSHEPDVIAVAANGISSLTGFNSRAQCRVWNMNSFRQTFVPDVINFGIIPINQFLSGSGIGKSLLSILKAKYVSRIICSITLAALPNEFNPKYDSDVSSSVENLLSESFLKVTDLFSALYPLRDIFTPANSKLAVNCCHSAGAEFFASRLAALRGLAKAFGALASASSVSQRVFREKPTRWVLLFMLAQSSSEITGSNPRAVGQWIQMIAPIETSLSPCSLIQGLISHCKILKAYFSVQVEALKVVSSILKMGLSGRCAYNEEVVSILQNVKIFMLDQISNFILNMSPAIINVKRNEDIEEDIIQSIIYFTRILNSVNDFYVQSASYSSSRALESAPPDASMTIRQRSYSFDRMSGAPRAQSLLAGDQLAQLSTGFVVPLFHDFIVGMEPAIENAYSRDQNVSNIILELLTFIHHLFSENGSGGLEMLFTSANAATNITNLLALGFDHPLQKIQTKSDDCVHAICLCLIDLQIPQKLLSVSLDEQSFPVPEFVQHWENIFANKISLKLIQKLLTQESSILPKPMLATFSGTVTDIFTLLSLRGWTLKRFVLALNSDYASKYPTLANVFGRHCDSIVQFMLQINQQFQNSVSAGQTKSIREWLYVSKQRNEFVSEVLDPWIYECQITNKTETIQ